MAFPPLDRIVLTIFLAGCLFIAGRAWLRDHPEYDPWAPLALDDPPGWATEHKLAALRSDKAQCRAFLARSGIDVTALPPEGEGACHRADRKTLAAPAHLDVILRPAGAQATCGVDAGLAWWLRHGVQPAAEETFGQAVVRIEHLGTANCRRIGGGEQGNWSEHARGNAIDIAAFVFADGRRVTVLRDWKASGTSDEEASAFLHMVRDSACTSFSTVLSPDYNAAHADHLHLDQASRTQGWSACR
ncbi:MULTISPECIES: extensin family protein [unclassified Novosphingobium]|uniref:extensin-like domain-containing protein n=1 Tax=unclassified Novosphingobium TaxID=2644732 RepID=UPI00135828FC|nr:MULTISPECIES: extensin family protein [unclassified Novosphingobium]